LAACNLFKKNAKTALHTARRLKVTARTAYVTTVKALLAGNAFFIYLILT